MHTLVRVLRRRDLVGCGIDASALDAARTMEQHHVGALPVLRGDALVGIFSERDLMTRVVVAARDPATTPVTDVMTRDVVTAELDDTRGECIAKMQRVGCRHLPVLSEGRVVSVISMRDLLRDEIAEQGEEIQNLRAYLHQMPV